jgi:hypothetical protein
MEMTHLRSAGLGLLAAVGLLAGAPAAGDPSLNLVPVDHRLLPPLRVKIWTDRGPDALYYPGERVAVRFTTNDDAYVCVYNIDTEGHVRVLFPARGDDGFVHAREVVTLPGPYASYDLVVSGPPGIETIEAIASRASLAGWDDAWEGEDEEWDQEEWEDEDEEWDGERDEDWDEEEEWDDDEGDEDDDYEWEGDETRLESRPIPRPRATGLRVSGDPFVAIRRVNRRLLGSPCDDRDYDTDYVSFCVGQRVRYPRYACNDCHGSYHGYDPYGDHCSVFSVRVNVHWGYPRHHVYVVHRHVLEPRYIYIRHQDAPHRYKHLKRTWTSHEGSRLRKEFRGTPAWKPSPKAVKRERHLTVPPSGGSKGKPLPSDKPRRTYRSKVERSPSPGEVEKSRPAKRWTEWTGEGRKKQGDRKAEGKVSERGEAPRKAKFNPDGSGKPGKWKAGEASESNRSRSIKSGKSSKSRGPSKSEGWNRSEGSSRSRGSNKSEGWNQSGGSSRSKGSGKSESWKRSEGSSKSKGSSESGGSNKSVGSNKSTKSGKSGQARGKEGSTKGKGRWP